MGNKTISSEKTNIESGNKKKNLIILISITVITIALWQIPGGQWIIYPFTILGTWFHEMGHGLTALILGGDFIKLEILASGSGLAVHSGALFFGDIGRAMVAAGGPLGPTIAGACFIALSSNSKMTKVFLYILGFIMVISVVIWIRSLTGAIFITAFGLIILTIAIKFNDNVKSISLQILGVQACASVYLSFGYLFSAGANVGGNNYLSDTAVISGALFLPYWFWGGLIILLSIFLIFKSLKFALSKIKAD